MKTSTIVAILVVLMGILMGWYLLGLPPMQNLRQAPVEGVMCTADAMQCPDGSYVGRTGPNCEFICPAATTTSTGGGILPYNSGIRGTVMAGPSCPVERDPPEPGCADKPVATNVSVFRTSDPQRAVAVTHSSAQGTFQVSLPPGSYIIMSGPYGMPYPRCNDTTAVVDAAGYTEVVVSCDTGIR